MKDLITYLAKALATRPDEVSVAEVVGDKGNTLELTVADEDLNCLIGKQGRTVKAMRSLLAAAATKNGQRYYLTITSPSSDQNSEDSAFAVGQNSTELSYELDDESPIPAQKEQEGSHE